jgi:hypothetical protein
VCSAGYGLESVQGPVKPLIKRWNLNATGNFSTSLEYITFLRRAFSVELVVFVA